MHFLALNVQSFNFNCGKYETVVRDLYENYSICFI